MGADDVDASSAHGVSLDSRIRRVPRTTGTSGSMTKRMRGRSVSTVHMVAEMGLSGLSEPAFQAPASSELASGRPRSALWKV